MLQDVCGRLHNGDILIRELQNVKEKRTQMGKLCVAAASEHDKSDVSMASIEVLNASIDQRMKEYQCFKGYRQHLSYLISHLSSVRLQGIYMYVVVLCIYLNMYSGPDADQLQVGPLSVFLERPINSLCSTVDGRCHVHCFPAAAPLEQCVSKFWTMSHDCGSDLFSDCWNDTIANLKPKGSLALKDVVPKVWVPVFTHCEKLLQQLMDYTISLATVDQLFKDKTNITQIIQQLNKSVEMCRSGVEVKDFVWVEQVVERMEQFWELCRYEEAAQAILELRKALNITGSFDLVEKVACQVKILVCLNTCMGSVHCPVYYIGHQLYEDTTSH